MYRSPVVPFTVYTGRTRLCAGRAAAGSTANSLKPALGWCSDPDRYTTPPLTAQDGLPELYVPWLDCQPLSRLSSCQLTPVTTARWRASPRPAPSCPDAACAALGPVWTIAAEAGAPPAVAITATSTAAAAGMAAKQRTGRMAPLLAGSFGRCWRPPRPRNGHHAVTSDRAPSFVRFLLMTSPRSFRRQAAAHYRR